MIESPQQKFLLFYHSWIAIAIVGLEDIFDFSEIHILNFMTNKKVDLKEKSVNSESW